MSDSPDNTPLHYRLDDLRIDVARQRVIRDDGQELDVSGLSFRLLHYLLTQGTRVVGFDALISNIWAPAVVNEETITQRVRLLRQALGDDGKQARYLRSVRGQGYQLCSEPVVEEPAVGVASVPSTKRRWIIIPATLLLLIAAGVLYWQWPTRNPAAVSPLLQRADYYAGIGQRDNNERAIALYRQRLQEAPDDVQAQLGIARAQAARRPRAPACTTAAAKTPSRLCSWHKRQLHASRGWRLRMRHWAMPTIAVARLKQPWPPMSAQCNWTRLLMPAALRPPICMPAKVA